MGATTLHDGIGDDVRPCEAIASFAALAEARKIVTLRLMWAQLIRVQSDPVSQLNAIAKELQALEQPGSGLVRSTVMLDQKDPTRARRTCSSSSEPRRRLAPASRIRAAQSPWNGFGR